MNEHDRIKGLLPLSASGDISPEELRLLREHIAGCETCRRLNEDYACLSGALRSIATPQPSPELLSRVRGMADSRLVPHRKWSGDTGLVALLVVCSWTVALWTWPFLQAAAGWTLGLWRAPGEGLGAMVAIYSVAGFLFASLAAPAVARYAKMNRRTR